ncbi:MAG TPA: copper transporter [Streptosporangiaceae bacterium]|nr:copper transporter [Streptosporangiaceae bacterium]
MIDFRYHLVSIIAVFLALAVGLVVGSTALSGKSEALLIKAQHELSRTNDTLTKDRQALIQQVTADQAFTQANATRLIGGLLPGESAVLVVAPGADSAVTDGVTHALTKAGAHVTGQVSLSGAFLDTSGPTESTLTQLAQRLQSTANVTLPSQPDSPAVAGQQAAAAVLATAIVTKSTSVTPSPSSRQFILNSFSQQGFLSVSAANGGTTLGPASLAVLVVPAGPPTTGTAGINASEALVAVAHELGAASDGTVMAGGVSSIATNSPIDEEKSNLQVSTVDNADTMTGQIMVVQALRLRLDGKAPAQYGIQPGAAPSPAPVPTPTAGANSKPSPKTTPSAGARK